MFLDLTTSSIALFSRAHCGAICAVLIPANLGLATAVIAATVLNLSSQQRTKLLGLSILAATMMVLHVGTWLAIGVVHLFTFILLGLAVTCLAVDALAWFYPNQIRPGLLRLLTVVSKGLSLQQLENWLKAEIIS